MWMAVSGIVTRSGLQPPYISYGKFRELLDQIGANRLSGALNPDTWGAPSQGADRFTNALRFLGLVGPDLVPQWELRQFARANAADRQGILRNVFVSRFRWVTQLPAGTSYEEFLADLGRHCSLTGERRVRAASFVSAAAEDLGIAIPVARPRKGPRQRPLQAPFQVGSLPSSDGLASVRDHCAYLLDHARRSSRRGDLDAERYYLGQLQQLSLALLARQTTPA